MNHFIKIALLIIALWLGGGTIAQPILNERYDISGETNSIYGSVIATDSCYYVSGVCASSPFSGKAKGSFVKYNLDGTVEYFSKIENDTLGIDLWQGRNMIRTLDNNLAIIAKAKVDAPAAAGAYLFVKINPSTGDTLRTNYWDDFYELESNDGFRPSSLIQNADSTYYGLAHIQRTSDLLVGVVFFRLDKYGKLIYWENYYGLSIETYDALKEASLVRIGENRLVIGAGLRDYDGPFNIDRKAHLKLIVIDTLGEIIEEHTYWDDTLGIDCNSLTKTADGGLLFCGRKGRYEEETNGIWYWSRIVKINPDFSIGWELESSQKGGASTINLVKIMPLSDSEFVAVGEMAGHGVYAGYLLKFNIDGEKIWERHYYKVPRFEGEVNLPVHKLYDVDQTLDGGFVMVGEATNFYDNGYLEGQKAWLVKTNRYGCIVPGCQFGDNPMDTEPKDSTIIQKPPKPEEPKTWLYPNPATKSLFYYHHQDVFNFGTVYIYNSSGQLVQKWEITTNDITYEIDVSGFASGHYVLQVLDGDGNLIEVERFVKI